MGLHDVISWTGANVASLSQERIYEDVADNVTDAWHEATDPDDMTDREEYVEALYRTSTEADSYMTAGGHGTFHENAFTYQTHRLIGLRIETTDCIGYLTRDMAISILGAERVEEWEALMDRNAPTMLPDMDDDY